MPPCDDLIDGSVADSILWMCDASERDLVGFLTRGNVRLDRHHWDDEGHNVAHLSTPLSAVLQLRRSDLFELFLQVGISPTSLRCDIEYFRSKEPCLALLLVALDAEPSAAESVFAVVTFSAGRFPADVIHSIVCLGVDPAAHVSFFDSDDVECIDRLEVLVQAGVSEEYLASLFWNGIFFAMNGTMREIVSYVLHLRVIDSRTKASCEEELGISLVSFNDLIGVLSDSKTDRTLPNASGGVWSALLLLCPPHGSIEMLQTLLFSGSQPPPFPFSQGGHSGMSVDSLVGFAAALNQDDPDDLFWVELLLSAGSRVRFGPGWRALAQEAANSADGIGMIDLMASCVDLSASRKAWLALSFCKENLTALQHLLSREWITDCDLASVLVNFPCLGCHHHWSFLLYDNCEDLSFVIDWNSSEIPIESALASLVNTLSECPSGISSADKALVALFLQSGLPIDHTSYRFPGSSGARQFSIYDSSCFFFPDTETFCYPPGLFPE